MREYDWTMPHRLSVSVPHVADYFGAWNVYAPAFEAIVSRCQGMDLQLHIQQAQAPKDDDEDDGYELTPEGVALFMCCGPMMKARSSMGGGTSTVQMRRQIGKAKRDPACKGGMFLFDTPGGTAKGNADLADDVAAFAAAKPCMAFIEDLCASAGVSIVSQCPVRYANTPACLYGAMGTYSVLTDSSEMAGKLGCKVHVIRAGAYKGMGEPGVEITGEQLAEAQRIVNLLNEQYLSLIARGLGKPLEAIRSLADGRIHSATDAVGMGLLTGVKTFDAAYSEIVAMCSPNHKRSAAMADTKQAATLAELKQTFPGSSAEWRESQLEAGASLSESAIAYATHVEARAKVREAEMQGQIDAAKKAPASLGHRPLRERDTGIDASAETGNAREDFEAAVAKVAGPHPSLERRHNAIRSVARKQPALYQAYLVATNQDGGAVKRRLLGEKLDQLNTDQHCKDYAVTQ